MPPRTRSLIGRAFSSRSPAPSRSPARRQRDAGAPECDAHRPPRLEADADLPDGVRLGEPAECRLEVRVPRRQALERRVAPLPSRAHAAVEEDRLGRPRVVDEDAVARPAGGRARRGLARARRPRRRPGRRGWRRRQVEHGAALRLLRRAQAGAVEGVREAPRAPRHCRLHRLRDRRCGGSRSRPLGAPMRARTCVFMPSLPEPAPARKAARAPAAGAPRCRWRAPGRVPRAGRCGRRAAGTRRGHRARAAD